jgi:hypothetical protein
MTTSPLLEVLLSAPNAGMSTPTIRTITEKIKNAKASWLLKQLNLTRRGCKTVVPGGITSLNEKKAAKEKAAKGHNDLRGELTMSMSANPA